MNLPFLHVLLTRLRALKGRDVVKDEISEELRFHIEQRASELERQGLSHQEATRRARQRFGNVASLEDQAYDIRGGGILETVWQDVRYAVRLLRRQPVFSCVAIVTVGLGIGATTALFSVVDAAWLRPLPFPKPERLVRPWVEVVTPMGSRRPGPSLKDARTWRTLPGVADVTVWTPAPLIADTGQPERVAGQRVDENYFGVFGVSPMLGQSFTEESLRPGAAPVAILGHSYWRRRFNSDPRAVGQTIRLDRETATIIGVLPEGFEHAIDVWLPFNLPVDMRGFSAVYARLQDGASRGQVEREWTAALPQQGWPAGASLRLTPLMDDVTRMSRTTINTLSGGVALILLIACVNVAGLLLARGTSRAPELAIRASIGAGRARLIRQLMTESIVLASVGTVVGISIAWLSLDAIVAIVPLDMPSSRIPALNGVVLALTAVTSILTALIFGLTPARSLSRAAARSLAGGGPRTGDPMSRKTGQALIAIEVALAIVLMTGAGLLLKSFDRLVAVDLGFDPDSVLFVRAAPLDRSPESFRGFYSNLLNTVRQMPGVEAAGAIDFVPLRGGSTNARFNSQEGVIELADTQYVLPGYFEAFGLEPQSGRVFEPGERDRRSVVLDDLAASLLFPLSDAVGGIVSDGKVSYEVVGVVRHIKRWGALFKEEHPNVYRLVPATHTGVLDVVLRRSSEGGPPADMLRSVAMSSGNSVLVDRVGTGNDLLNDKVAGPRHRTILLGLLGSLGLLLTLVGIASVTAYAVARRTREIGVRMAFGAAPGSVVWTMMRDAAWPMAAGLAAGLCASFYATRVVASFLFETTPTDPATFTAAALVLLVTAAIAAWLPARRAARVDPVEALRAE